MTKAIIFVVVVVIGMSTGTVIGIPQPQNQSAEAQGQQQSTCPQITSNPYTNKLLCDARGIIGATSPSSDQYKEKQWNPPHNWPEINQICARQAAAKGYGYGSQLASQYCAPIPQNCVYFEFTLEECYAFSFVALGTLIPADIQNGVNMKIQNANDKIDVLYRQLLCPDKEGNYGDYC